MKTKLYSLFIFLALICGVHRALGQGTAFTYQGQLDNGTNPVTGLYDIRFHLYSALTGGTLLGGPTTNTAVPVTNGVFTVMVDFGPNVFIGSSNWLNIGVRPTGVGAFIALTPRTQVTPTPYAIFAETADAAGLAGAIPAGDLSGVSGSGLTSLNASQLTSGTVAPARLPGDVAYTDVNQTFTGANIFNTGTGAGRFTVNGSSGIDTTLFSGLGLQFYNSSGEGAIMSSFNDGFSSLGFYTKQGGGFPIAKQMKIDRYGGVAIDQQNWNNGTLNDGTTNGVGLTFGITSGEGIASERQAGTANPDGLDFYTDFTQRLLIQQGGNILIPSPSQTIVFPATSGANSPMMAMFSSGTVNADRMVIAHSLNYPTWGLQYQDNPDRFNFLSAGTAVMSINLGYPNGVGIGVTNPVSALEVASGDVRIDGHELYLEPNSGSFANDGMVFGDGGLPGINSGYGPWIAGYFGGALGALAPNVVALSWDSGGDCSVSNNLSVGSLTVRGDYLVVNGGTPVYAYIGDDGVGNDVQIGSQRSGITALAAYNSADQAYMHFYCSSITIEGGSDLAEPFKITSGNGEVPQGAVVVIDEQNPGHLKMSDLDYDTHVAGVVSGANGINPGIQMQQQGLLDGGKNVALTGRVYVQADASNGAIKPGDLLTTSRTPGHAMKVTDHARAAGAILGKAMTGLSNGQGMVLVLVSLQ
jgi:hypothetical protein